MSTPEAPDSPSPAPRKATLSEVVNAVIWGFLGIRKRKHLQRDAASIRPHQVLIVGLALTAVFVILLLGLVQLILHVAGVARHGVN